MNPINRFCAFFAASWFGDDLLSVHTVLNNEYKISGVERNLLCILRAAEDKRFFSHPGFDLLAIIRAFFMAVIYRRNSGASTIDQQLVRSITGRRERTITRKMREIVLATAINERYDKNSIAIAYMNIAYFGWKMEGVGKALERLDKECLFPNEDIPYVLVSLLKYPLPRNPSFAVMARVRNRVVYIKRRLYSLGIELGR